MSLLVTSVPLFTLVLPAAGSGKRMNASVPKPLLQLADRTVLYWTLKPFLEFSELNQIIIPTQKPYFDQIREICDQAFNDNRKKVVPKLDIIEGGEERLFSIANAMGLVEENSVLVSVHDAVRPLVSVDSIRQNLLDATVYKAAILALPPRETIKEVDGEKKVVATPDRSKLWSVQTPQTFEKKLLQQAYTHALQSKYFGTDDASVVEFFGESVFITQGNPENIKLTYPIDMMIAHQLLSNNASSKQH